MFKEQFSLAGFTTVYLKFSFARAKNPLKINNNKNFVKLASYDINESDLCSSYGTFFCKLFIQIWLAEML